MLSIPVTGNESPQHQRAKLRLYNLLKENGFYPEFEIATGITKTEIGERNYTVDIFAFWPNLRTRIAFEIDGKSHYSKWSRHKMANRDKAHRQKGILTVRIDVRDLVGKNKQDDDTIIGLVEEQIQQQ